MFVTGFLLSYLLAISLTLVLAVGYRGLGLGMRLVCYFLVVFLATWAGGLWLPPVGPLILDVPWLTFALVAVTSSLVMTGLISRGQRRLIAIESVKTSTLTKMAPLDLLYWILISGLAVVVVLRFYLPS